MKRFQVKRRGSERSSQKPPASPHSGNRNRASTGIPENVDNTDACSTSGISVHSRSSFKMGTPKFVTGFVDLVTRRKTSSQK